MQDKDWPLVTVFTLVYNTGKYVVQALESVRANKYLSIQHIIIDDCSTDGASVQIVEQWIRENKYDCEFIKHEKNQGICKSLNEILALTKGKYMLGVSDDLLSNTRITDHIKMFEASDENTAIVFSDISIIDRGNKVVQDSYFVEVGKDFGPIPTGNVYYELLKKNFISAVGVTMRSSSIREVGGFDDSLYFEDWDLWLRLSKKYLFKRIDEIGGYYRKHDQSVWENNSIKIQESSALLLLKHLSDKKSKAITINSIFHFSENIYKHDSRQASKLFLKIFQVTYSFKALIFFIAGYCRVPYSYLVRN
ncbi:MAG TPA: glycosyltransferase [Cyclobacteriaceae bacterium]|jgi:glycosyltransferase involved in cell wall biosynthesis|nr:glycosyltransferase [Cyclobacteriaceae bacterium]